MSRRSTGLAVAIGAAIAVGAVVAFAAGKKTPAVDEDDEGDDDAPALPDAAPVSPVVPGTTTFPSEPTPLGTPPFVPPGLIQVSNPIPVAPAVPQPPIVPTPVQPAPPVVQLPDDDDEGTIPTVNVPGVTIPGSVTLPGGVQVSVPPIPGITAPATPAPIPSPPVVAVEQPSIVPGDTAALVALMLNDEASPTWKRKYPELGMWQAARGRTVDQMFGPGDALAMAKEIGTLPIIRYWPRGTLPQTALPSYRSQLAAIAATAPEPRRAQLLMTSAREQGQAFAGPASTVPIATRVNLTAVA